jgi:AcrR family transcriptional regulator
LQLVDGDEVFARDSATKRGKYELKRRAKRQEETRQRITEAAVELHGTVGSTRATISAIAERAGVQRRTVYNHFPTEHALLTACMGHYWASNPLPDPSPWEGIAEPDARLRRALGEVYAFYGRHERLLANLDAAAHVNPTVRAVARPYYRHWERVRDILAAAWKARDGQRHLLGAALDLARLPDAEHAGGPRRDRGRTNGRTLGEDGAVRHYGRLAT